ncbi:NUDIX hydrolase [Spongiactinospora sp. TRM90649]|uniref:NUDIX hydrolase n=1 Tax=Spongiactinospora sp. TRM90649 TaxID=3031114 RepID=UPI0023F9ED7C|nr:NUDIX hydrolase [Spongiactinospora sp. TRM90649]MDF5754853.1 NUDIX hydrolase [Spongiactinospora sp. TRM90649]
MNGFPLSRELGPRARDVMAGRVAPVPARDASTVVILRPARSNGFEVYLIRRKVGMAFAAGAYVFPGGSVDPRDIDHPTGWSGPSPEEWAVALGSDPSTARGLVCAAVRETFEESGVLLAGPDDASIVTDTTGDDWEADRLALIDRRLSFADFLGARGLVLRSDLLRPWSHWITPEVEARRFDTRFFVAALPPGQRTRDVGGEADKVTWMRPADALARSAGGEIRLMTPTYRTIAQVGEYADMTAVLAAQREIVPILPVIVEVDGEIRVLRGGDA